MISLIFSHKLVWIVFVASAGILVSNVSASSGLPPVVRTPNDRFDQLSELGYPWEPHYFLQNVTDCDVPLRLHYIDEGPRDANETLLLLHGMPAWSFLYRKVIPGLLDAGYRVVALDQVGFGRSDKLTDKNAYTHEINYESVLLLLEELDLQGVTLFVQDLGGPTGISAMSRDPLRFRRVVMLNTWLPQGDVFTSFSRIFEHSAYLTWRTTVGLLGQLLPIETVMTLSTTASPDAISGGYGAPFPSPLYKAGPAWWPFVVPLSLDEPMALEMQNAANFLRSWNGPSMLGYSDREVFTVPGKALLQSVLPESCQVFIKNAGHFLQDDQGPLIAAIVVAFIENDCNAVQQILAQQ